MSKKPLRPPSFGLHQFRKCYSLSEPAGHSGFEIGTGSVGGLRGAATVRQSRVSTPPCSRAVISIGMIGIFRGFFAICLFHPDRKSIRMEAASVALASLKWPASVLAISVFCSRFFSTCIRSAAMIALQGGIDRDLRVANRARCSGFQLLAPRGVSRRRG